MINIDITYKNIELWYDIDIEKLLKKNRYFFNILLITMEKDWVLLEFKKNM